MLVETGNKLGSGTDANVFLIIYGDKGQTNKIPLNKSLSNKNPFEKGTKDLFKVIISSVGEISKINISHDGKGAGAGWYVESIEITNTANKKSVK